MENVIHCVKFCVFFLQFQNEVLLFISEAGEVLLFNSRRTLALNSFELWVWKRTG
jgi:hypothetical protein